MFRARFIFLFFFFDGVPVVGTIGVVVTSTTTVVFVGYLLRGFTSVFVPSFTADIVSSYRPTGSPSVCRPLGYSLRFTFTPGIVASPTRTFRKTVVSPFPYFAAFASGIGLSTVPSRLWSGSWCPI